MAAPIPNVADGRIQPPGANVPASLCNARLYDAHAEDREVTCEQLGSVRPGEFQVLWVDLQRPDPDVLKRLWQDLALPERLLEDLPRTTHPAVLNSGKFFRVCAVAVDGEAGLDFQGTPIVLVAGENIVVTLHDTPVGFVDRLRDREDGQSDLGCLSAESFAASLLDWHLSTYFDASSTFEMAVERLEVEILDGRSRDCLPELRRLRRAASRLRRMLTPHRVVFGSLSRPDFRPLEGVDADRHFIALDTRFERAMDMVENARDLVMGSFELFSGQTALQTNDSMRVLTFATVVIGVLAVLAGVLGMNFGAGFFEANTLGFSLAVAGMVLLAGISIFWGRRKHWI